MGHDLNSNRGFRLLGINKRLEQGEILCKSTLAKEYGVTPKTIQRDIDDLRAYLVEAFPYESKSIIKYDKKYKGYYLTSCERDGLTNEEVLVLCKILLESRAFCKKELNLLLTKLIREAAPNERKLIEETIRSERFYYVPLKHNKELFHLIWVLSQHIAKQEVISILYKRKDGVTKEHRIKPVAIMFSEYYFYLITFLADDSKDYPTIFRIDRVVSTQFLNENFKIFYKNRFNEGEFRKRVQFMYSGPLRKVKFEYSGQSIEAVLDRLPTAEIISKDIDKYLIQAEVYGDGIDMWLKSQGDNIRVV